MKPPPMFCGLLLGAPVQHIGDTEPWPVRHSLKAASMSAGEQLVCGKAQLLQQPGTIGALMFSQSPGSSWSFLSECVWMHGSRYAAP